MNIKLSDHFSYSKLLKFSLPGIFMMLVTTSYSIVDGIFVTNIVGKNAFAAVNLIMPVLMAIGAIGTMIGSGGSALLSLMIGSGEHNKANRVFSFLIAALFVTGAVLAVPGFIYMPSIARLLGAEGQIVDYCVLYGRILIAVIPFYLLQCSFQSLYVTAEKPKMGLITSLICGATNIVLDFLCIYVFRFGIGGAAVATALSWVVGGVFPVIYFAVSKNNLLRFVRPLVSWKALGRACGNGSSEMVSNISVSVVAILYNAQLMKYAGADGVAAFGVIMYISFIFLAFSFGYAMSVTPIVGYHYGAGHHKELENIRKKSITLTIITNIVMLLLAELTAGVVSDVYCGYDVGLREMTFRAIQIYSISYLFSGFNIFASAFFTGLNNGKVSATISFLRAFVLQIITVLLLPAVFGIQSIWWAVTISEGVTLLVTIKFFVTNKKKYKY